MSDSSKSKTTADVVELLEKIAQLLELSGENPFKIRAYTRAARTVELLSEPIIKLVKEERLGEVDGIGKAIEEKITDFVTTGELPYYEELRSQFPTTLFELFELQGLGAKKIHQLYKELGVSSLADLQAACTSGKVAALPGFGTKSVENIEKAIAFHHQQAGLFRIDEVSELANELLEDLRAHPNVGQCQSAGSFRRCKEAIGDLDLLVSSNNPGTVSEFFVKHPLVQEVLMHGPTKSSVRLKVSPTFAIGNKGFLQYTRSQDVFSNHLGMIHTPQVFKNHLKTKSLQKSITSNCESRATQEGHAGLQCDLRVVKPEEFPFALVYFTGSKEHNIRLRSRALEQGWSLNEYRFTVQEQKKNSTEKISSPPKIHDEAELYASLGLDFIPPELREDRGEIAAAAAKQLPELVTWQSLKGTFHCHTKASDGQNTLLEMATAAQDLGLEYLGIADHSKSSVQAHGLDEKRLAEQVAEIKKLNATFDGFRIFAGTECDILKDGSLDFSDEVLASLDYVVASVHSSFTLGETEMTQRIIRAMENPYVTMIGHLTGRILFSRASYAVNVPAIIEAAAATGTILELNANPKRLDMDWRWWPLAKEKGVRCVINPDAHKTAGIQNLIYGVGAARKGWLTKNDVINCLRTDEVEKILAAKRLN